MSTNSECLYLPEVIPGEVRELATSTRLWALLFLIHVPFSLLLQREPAVGVAHCLLAVCCGLHAAFTGRVDRVAYTAAYIAGAEVLWRMTSSGLFWEFGKYAIVLLFLVSMVRNPKWRQSPLALAYFALLLPSCVITATALDLDETRRQISFNLSGPLALSMSVWFFSNVQFKRANLSRLLLAYMAPLVSVVSITLGATFLSGPVRFGTNSNFATSGGFGPNQVASILGLGVLAGLLAMVLANPRSLVFRLLLLVMAVLCGIQSAMTFSRSGLMLAAAAALIGGLFLLRDPRARTQMVVFCLAGYVSVNYLILPQLDSFTGGALTHRFQSTNLSHRDDLALADLAIWLENPVGGSGPGVSKSERAAMTHSSSIAHTEFTRLLSDHGLFGLVAGGMLFLMGLRMVRNARRGGNRAFVAVVVSWSLIYMMLNGMRLAAPSFLFGLGALQWVDLDAYLRFYCIETGSDAHPSPEEEIV